MTKVKTKTTTAVYYVLWAWAAPCSGLTSSNDGDKDGDSSAEHRFCSGRSQRLPSTQVTSWAFDYHPRAKTATAKLMDDNGGGDGGRQERRDLVRSIGSRGIVTGQAAGGRA